MENMVAVTQTAGAINCDFESVKKRLQERLQDYKGAVFTEESKTFAKAELANLRNEKKEFSDRVKEVKTAYMQPYLDFEGKAKELIALYDEPINLIDDQIKAFEEKRKAEKQAKIADLYQMHAGGLEAYIPLQKIYNPKWENATMKEKDLVAEISNLAEATRSAIATIRGMQSEAEEKALEIYKENLSLPEAMTYITNYEKQKQEIIAREQERRKKEEEERIRREERERLEEQRRIKEEQEAAIRKAEEEKEAALRRIEEEKAAAIEKARAEAEQAVIESLTPNVDAGDADLYEYRIELTKDAKEKLETYMDSVGIEWELM